MHTKTAAVPSTTPLRRVICTGRSERVAPCPSKASVVINYCRRIPQMENTDDALCKSTTVGTVKISHLSNLANIFWSTLKLFFDHGHLYAPLLL